MGSSCAALFTGMDSLSETDADGNDRQNQPIDEASAGDASSWYYDANDVAEEDEDPSDDPDFRDDIDEDDDDDQDFEGGLDTYPRLISGRGGLTEYRCRSR